MKVDFTLNGKTVAWEGPPITRLAAALRSSFAAPAVQPACCPAA